MGLCVNLGPHEGQEQKGVLLSLWGTVNDAKTPNEKSLREKKKRSMVPSLVVCLRG